MKHDPRQLDLFADPSKAAAACVAHANASASRRRQRKIINETPSDPAPRDGLGRDETTILRFPTAAWAPRLWQSRVEKTAVQLIQRKTERGRQNLWTSTCRTLFAQMQRRGATAEEIERQIDDFHAAVSWRLSEQQSGPGAA